MIMEKISIVALKYHEFDCFYKILKETSKVAPHASLPYLSIQKNNIILLMIWLLLFYECCH